MCYSQTDLMRLPIPANELATSSGKDGIEGRLSTHRIDVSDWRNMAVTKP